MGRVLTQNLNVPKNAVEWVKANVKFIGNITSFEIYQGHNLEDIPDKYQNVPGFYLSSIGEKKDHTLTYNFILRDDVSETETWLQGCNCGYDGSGPNATKKILQLLGIKINYDEIYKKSKIIMQNIVPRHDLNIVFFNPETKECMKALFNFKEAHQKLEAKNALGILGGLEGLRPLNVFAKTVEDVHDVRILYLTESEKDNEVEWYADDFGIILDDPFTKLQSENLQKAVRKIALKYRYAKYEITNLLR
jgi:hypothetical protein